MPNLSPNPLRFSERGTEEHYDAEGALYRSFRDAEGSLHWGVVNIGIDLSGVRDANTIEPRGDVPELAPRPEFHKASGTELPFEDGAVFHVWSQATINHIPDKIRTLDEAYRAQRPGGVMVVDDLTKPRPDISEGARTFSYDRLLFATDFGCCTYVDALRDAGFKVFDARDLPSYFARSHCCLSQMAAHGSDPERQKRLAALSDA